MIGPHQKLVLKTQLRHIDFLNTYLSSQYHRLAARRGANRAAVAVAHSILTIVYYMLKQKQRYFELGPAYYEERKRETVMRQSIKKLESLGYKVTVELIA